MSQVKGALILEIARLIRANKDKNWDKYLTKEDKEILFSRVLPTSWYPMSAYERAGYAILMEIGQGKFENAKLWGRFVIDDTIKRYYHNLSDAQDPMVGIERFRLFRKQWFKFDDPNFEAIEITKITPDQAKVTLRSDYPTPYFEAYTHQSIGSLERLVELNGGKEIKIIIEEHDWKGERPYTVFLVSWKK